jgi:acyl-coenzyme A synthetase/AMP-(fatty) acid ligase
VELIASAVEGVNDVCCVFDEKRDFLILYYTGNDGTDNSKINMKFRAEAEVWLRPNKIIRLEQMPLLANGKINRSELTAMATK